MYSCLKYMYLFRRLWIPDFNVLPFKSIFFIQQLCNNLIKSDIYNDTKAHFQIIAVKKMYHSFPKNMKLNNCF